ncbi:MAG: hypothetical protein Q7U11_15935 [Phenylobacterium sp.]|nr:hypothetical protein [Phenylobacterium sp.]
MDVTDIGFLAAGAVAVVTGLTAPLRPDMAPPEGVTTLRPLLAAIVCTAICAGLIVMAPGMLKDTPLAVVLVCSLAHAAVTAGKALSRHRHAPGVPRRNVA